MPGASPCLRKSSSSQLSCPTSPMRRSPFLRSNENLHGLRRPYATITGVGVGSFTSRRRSFPRREDLFWALLLGSPAPPPSPVPRYRIAWPLFAAIGSNWSCPPLWFEYPGWAMERRTCREAGSARFGLEALVRNLAITMVPERFV